MAQFCAQGKHRQAALDRFVVPPATLSCDLYHCAGASEQLQCRSYGHLPTMTPRLYSKTSPLGDDMAHASKISNYPSYDSLIRGLIAGVQVVGFFRPDGKCDWISAKKAGMNLMLLAKEVLRTGRGVRNIEAEESMSFALPLRGKNGIVGIVGLTVSTSDSDNWDMTLERIETALQPVVTVLSHELAARVAAPKTKVLTERTEELEWLFSVTAELRSGSSDSAAVEQLLRAAVERMKASYGGLAVTEKRLNVTYASPKHADPTAPIAYAQAHPHLMSFVQRQKKSMVINKPASGRANLHSHKIMAVPILTQSGKVAGLLAFFKPSDDADFARREQYLGRHIARQVGALLDSQYDLATGLYTRVAFEQQVNQFLNGRPDRMHSLVYIDIDELHTVNDAFGYEAGDELIVRVADSLRPPALPGDAIAARTAGDRFLLFLPGYDTEEAHDCAVNLQKLIAEITLGSGTGRITVSFSCGVSRLLEVDQPVARAIAAAELACKTAKERGRNRCEVYLDVDASMMRRRVDVAGLEKLRDALEQDRMVLYGRRIAPIGDVASTAAVECMVAIRNPDGSVVQSSELMSTAKRFKLLKEIDEWAIKNALTMLAPYASMMLHSGMRVAIDISGDSLNDEDLVARIADWVRASKVPPGRITFEIAETAAVSNLALANKLIRGLQQMGCRFTLDAFGTGVNSLSYLKSLHVHSVKIDGSYVRDIATNPRSASMVRAIVDVARSLDIESIADLVESDAVLKKLHELGVDYVQGGRIHEPQEMQSLLDAQTHAASQAIRQLVLVD